MNGPLSYATALTIGLLGGVHCIGMCGGIVGALSYAIPVERRTAGKVMSLLLSYNLGRIASYTVAGALVGSLGWLMAGLYGPAGMILRLLAGLMLIAMGLYLAGWWRGLARLEQAGSRWWRKVQPLGNRYLPVTRPAQAVLLGMLWGWLPCGLVYSVLTWAATATSWRQAALIMLCFGAGTLPAMLLTGRFAQQVTRFVQTGTTRYVAAALVMVFGVWTVLPVFMHHDHHDHQHMLQPEQQTSGGTLDHSHHMH